LDMKEEVYHFFGCLASSWSTPHSRYTRDVYIILGIACWLDSMRVLLATATRTGSANAT
jgi:hypothetical protein